MKKYKLEGKKYPLYQSSTEPIDGYACKGQMTYSDEEPKGKFRGYVLLDEGSWIACYSKFNPLLIIVPVILVFLIFTVLVAFVLLNQEQDIAIGDTMLRTSVDENIVVFNGIMSYADGNIDLRFVNGDYETTVTVTGEGVNPTAAVVAPGESLYNLPVVVSTDANVIEASVTFETATSTATYPVLIEIPDNMSTTTGLTDYFEGENIIYE